MPLMIIFLLFVFSSLTAVVVAVDGKECKADFPVSAKNISFFEDCTISTGDVVLSTDVTSSMIDTYLDQLTEIRGRFAVENNNLITHISLHSLVTCDLILLKNLGSVDSISFPVLRATTSELHLEGNPNLHTVSLPHYHQFTHNLLISESPQLTQLDLDQLVGYAGEPQNDGYIYLQNLGLASVDLPALTHGLFQIRNLPLLHSINIPLWNSWKGVHPGFEFDGLPLLTTINVPLWQNVETMALSHLPSFTNTSVFRDLEYVRHWLHLIDMPWTNFQGFEQLRWVGNLHVQSNSNLESLAGLERLSVISQTNYRSTFGLLIDTQPLLIDVALPSLRVVDGPVTLRRLPKLVHIDSWAKLTTVKSVSIQDCALLDNINGFFNVLNLTSVTISGVPSLQSVSGLCYLHGSLGGSIDAPFASCQGISTVLEHFPAKPSVINCSHTKPMERSGCGCFALEALSSMLCSPDYVCANITQTDQLHYNCRYGQCSFLIPTGNTTVHATRDYIYPSTAIYQCLPGYRPVDVFNRTCIYDGTWLPHKEPSCIDIDECAMNPPPCDPRSFCFNTIGSYECSPYLIDGTLHAASSRAHDISNGVELEDNNGGQLVSFMIHNNSRFDMTLRWISSSAMYTDLQCQDIIIAEDPILALCEVPPAAGRGYHARLDVCLREAKGRCASTRLYSDVLHYPPLGFKRSTFRLAGEPASLGRAELTLSSSEPFNFTFDLNGHVTMLNHSIIQYGPSWNRFQYSCAFLSRNGSSVTCTTQKSFGTALKVTMFFDGQAPMLSDDYLTFPTATSPGVVRVTGCQGQQGVITTQCPTSGNIPVFIEATDEVAEPLRVLIGGAQCTSPSVVNNRTIRCSLPTGAGWQSVSIFVLGSNPSESSRLVWYAIPTIESITSSSCTNGSTASSVVNCARTGNSTLTIHGQNFGASLATVFIGTTSCRTRHDPLHPHSILYAQTPPGIDEGWSVLALQDGGGLSTTETSLSYSTCQPGYQTDSRVTVNSTNDACRACFVGKASSDGKLCVTCPSRHIAPRTGQSNCTVCPEPYVAVDQIRCELCPSGQASTPTGECEPCTAGTYSSNGTCHACAAGWISVGQGNSECRACVSGSYQSSPGQSHCVACEVGKWSNVSAKACIPCAPGTKQSDEGGRSCSMCPLGTYSSAGAATCLPCNIGYSLDPAVAECFPCQSGLSCRDGIAVVKQDYWSWITNVSSTLQLRAAACSNGRCFRANKEDICAPNRNQSTSNILCAACAHGYSEWGPGLSCIKCEEPNGGLIFVAFVLSFGLVVILHVVAQSESGISMVFFYFVQLSLLMAPPASYVLSWLTFLNFTPVASGVCIVPLTHQQQVLFSLLTPVALIIQLFLLMLVQGTLSCCGCKRLMKRCWPWHSYVRTLVDLYLFSYSSVATTLVSLLRCTTVLDNQSFVFDYPSISCDDSNYRIWSIVAVLCLVFVVILPPVAAFVALCRRRNDLSSLGATFGALFEMFHPKAFYWQIFVVLRRIGFITINLGIVALPSLKYFLFVLLHGLSLVLHLVVQPYRANHLNTIETITLSILTILASLLTAFPSPETVDAGTAGYDQTALQLTITLLIGAPVIVFLIYGLINIRCPSVRSLRSGSILELVRKLTHPVGDEDDAVRIRLNSSKDYEPLDSPS